MSRKNQDNESGRYSEFVSSTTEFYCATNRFVCDTLKLSRVCACSTLKDFLPSVLPSVNPIDFISHLLMSIHTTAAPPNGP